jgi:hypothetical protein
MVDWVFALYFAFLGQAFKKALCEIFKKYVSVIDIPDIEQNPWKQTDGDHTVHVHQTMKIFCHRTG